MRSALLRWATRGLLLAVSMILGLALAEGAVRLVIPQALPSYAPGIWIPDDTGLGHRLAADLDEMVNTGERDTRFRTDALGHRIGRSGPSSRAGELRVVTVGDSFLEAMAVGWADTITGRLEVLLSAATGRDAVVVNTGVSGTTPNHYRLFAERELARQPADAVVIFLFVGNDVVSHRRDELPKRPPQPREALRWPRGASADELVSAWVHPLYTALREHSHLVVLAKSRGLGLMVRLGLTDHSFPTVFLPSEADADRWRVTAEICAEIAARARAAGAPTLVVLLPPDYAIEREMGAAFAASAGLAPGEVDFDQPARILAALLEREGVATLDATPVLSRAWAEHGVPLFGRVDRHLSPAGHEVVAEAVADRLVPLLALVGADRPGREIGPKT